MHSKVFPKAEPLVITKAEAERIKAANRACEDIITRTLRQVRDRARQAPQNSCWQSCFCMFAFKHICHPCAATSRSVARIEDTRAGTCLFFGDLFLLPCVKFVFVIWPKVGVRIYARYRTPTPSHQSTARNRSTSSRRKPMTVARILTSTATTFCPTLSKDWACWPSALVQRELTADRT